MSSLVVISVEDLKEMIRSAVAEALQVYGTEQTSSQAQAPSDEFLTRKETAALLKVDKATLYRWDRTGVLPAQRIGRRILYCANDVSRLVKSGQ